MCLGRVNADACLIIGSMVRLVGIGRLLLDSTVRCKPLGPCACSLSVPVHSASGRSIQRAPIPLPITSSILIGWIGFSIGITIDVWNDNESFFISKIKCSATKKPEAHIGSLYISRLAIFMWKPDSEDRDSIKHLSEIVQLHWSTEISNFRAWPWLLLVSCSIPKIIFYGGMNDKQHEGVGLKQWVRWGHWRFESQENSQLQCLLLLANWFKGDEEYLTSWEEFYLEGTFPC